jgi:hypothetical protein
VHAQTVEDEARKMWASSQNIAGAGWSGTAQMTSYDTMGQMNTAFRNLEVPAARLPVKAVAAGCARRPLDCFASGPRRNRLRQTSFILMLSQFDDPPR